MLQILELFSSTNSYIKIGILWIKTKNFKENNIHFPECRQTPIANSKKHVRDSILL